MKYIGLSKKKMFLSQFFLLSNNKKFLKLWTYEAGFLNFSAIGILDCHNVESCPVHLLEYLATLASILEMPAAAYHYHPVVRTKNVSRQCQMFPARQKSLPIENHWYKGKK